MEEGLGTNRPGHKGAILHPVQRLSEEQSQRILDPCPKLCLSGVLMWEAKPTYSSFATSFEGIGGFFLKRPGLKCFGFLGQEATI